MAVACAGRRRGVRMKRARSIEAMEELRGHIDYMALVANQLMGGVDAIGMRRRPPPLQRQSSNRERPNSAARTQLPRQTCPERPSYYRRRSRAALLAAIAEQEYYRAAFGRLPWLSLDPHMRLRRPRRA